MTDKSTNSMYVLVCVRIWYRTVAEARARRAILGSSKFPEVDLADNWHGVERRGWEFVREMGHRAGVRKER